MARHEHRTYDRGELTDDAPDDPMPLLDTWLHDAEDCEGIEEPTAMTLATMDEFGPDARIVLLRGRDQRGLRFFTNRDSAKGRQLAGFPRAAVVFHWQPLERQVRVRGAVERLSPEEDDTYWADRPRASRVASAMSEQSRPIVSRDALQRQFAAAMASAEQDVARPAHWGGFRLLPHEVEFWQGAPARLHDRLLYVAHDDGVWTRQRLQP